MVGYQNFGGEYRLHIYFYPEDGSEKFLQNFGSHLQARRPLYTRVFSDCM
jgi:hypothetical protein